MCGGDSTEITPTADQVAQQQTNARLWNHYVQDYKPMIQKYAAQATDPTTKKGQAAQVSGQINAEVMKNIGAKSAENPVANMKQLTDVAGMKTAAEQSGAAKVAGKQAGDTQNVIDIGRGQATQANNDLGKIAEQSIQGEITNWEVAAQEQGAIENAAGSVIGGAAAGAMHGMKNNKALTPPGDMAYTDDIYSAYNDPNLIPR